MAEISKLAQLKALRERKLAGYRSRGGMEGHASAPGLPVANEHRDAKACSGALARSLDRGGKNPKGGDVELDTRQPAVGVEPGPRETKRGRPRIGETRDKPWIAAGLTERTYYRRQAEKRAKT